MLDQLATVEGAEVRLSVSDIDRQEHRAGDYGRFMANKLYVIPGSHPCAAVEAALKLKEIPYERVDWLPVIHRALGKASYGARTVPGIRFDSGEKLAGSRPIMRRLDELEPEPPLYPAGDTRVEEAETWGDEVLQEVARRLSWAVLKRVPRAAESFTAGANLPVPAWMARPSLPLVTRMSARLNHESDASTRADLQALPGHLDRIDAWIADGILGGHRPNAADLQIGASLALMQALGDIRPLIEGRPCERLVGYLAPVTGSAPAGVLPSEWLPANPAMSSASTPG
jgi:glutathione S-transferase